MVDQAQRNRRTVSGPTSYTRWFVASHSAKVVLRRGAFELVPTSTVHAKEMGTTVTACGRPAGTWRKLWDVPFPRAGRDVCEECQALVFAGPRAVG